MASEKEKELKRSLIFWKSLAFGMIIGWIVLFILLSLW